MQQINPKYLGGSSAIFGEAVGENARLNSSPSFEETKEKVRRFVQQLPLDEQPLNPFHHRHLLDRVRPSLLSQVHPNNHQKFDELYWEHLCENVVNGPMNETEILACLFLELDFSKELDLQRVSQQLYDVNNSFYGGLYQTFGKYRSVESLAKILQNISPSWSDLDIERLKTTWKAMNLVSKYFDPDLFRERASPKVYQSLEKLSSGCIEHAIGLFPGKTKEDLECKMWEILYSEEDLMDYPPEDVLSPEEKISRKVYEHLEVMEENLWPYNPFTDAQKLDILCQIVPELSAEYYWEVLSPAVEKGPFNHQEVFLLLLKPELLSSTTYQAEDVSKYLYEMGKRIDGTYDSLYNEMENRSMSGTYDSQRRYRSFRSIDRLREVQTEEWNEEQEQLLLNCIRAFKFGQENHHKFSFEGERDIRSRIRDLFVKNSLDHIEEIQFLFPGKTRQSIEAKYIELIS